jgi:hypothetical protein
MVAEPSHVFDASALEDALVRRGECFNYNRVRDAQLD